MEAAGGLHAFMNRQRPLITDSGGFQVFSLAYGSVHEEVNSLKRGGGKSRHKGEHNLVARVNEEGVVFRSYRCERASAGGAEAVAVVLSLWGCACAWWGQAAMD